MATQTKTLKFRVIARDETWAWGDNLPPGCGIAVGLYLFCEGEATHIASLTPSSWCEFLENQFGGLDPEHPFVEENAYVGDSDYFSYISPADLDNRPDVSEAREFSIEYVDGDDEEAVRRQLWEDARESFQANAPQIKALWEKLS